MKKIIKLTERDLTRIVKRVLKEGGETGVSKNTETGVSKNTETGVSKNTGATTVSSSGTGSKINRQGFYPHKTLRACITGDSGKIVAWYDNVFALSDPIKNTAGPYCSLKH